MSRRLTLPLSPLSPYTFCAADPINFIDPSGEKILLVNGFWIGNFLGRIIGSSAPKEQYWGIGFVSAAQIYFSDYSKITHSCYIDGSSKWGGDMSGQDRYDAGYKYAQKNMIYLTSGLKENETFNLVTHSEGAAYGAGIAQCLIDQGYIVTNVLHLSADEGDEFVTPIEPFTMQLSYENDWVTNNHLIQNVDKSGEIRQGSVGLKNVHGQTKHPSIFKAAYDLKNIGIQAHIGLKHGKSATWYSQVPGKNFNCTLFYRIDGYEIYKKDGTTY